MVTADRVRQLLNYDPDTGLFSWTETALKANGRKGRKGVGWNDGKGHLRAKVDSKTYKLHRLAWFHTYGVWPRDQIDHINGIKSDNRLNNLREATNSQNKANSRAYSSNRLGIKGVCKYGDKYLAVIRCNRKRFHLGYFPTPEEAAAAYAAAADRLFGEFARAA